MGVFVCIRRADHTKHCRFLTCRHTSVQSSGARAGTTRRSSRLPATGVWRCWTCAAPGSATTRPATLQGASRVPLAARLWCGLGLGAQGFSCAPQSPWTASLCRHRTGVSTRARIDTQCCFGRRNTESKPLLGMHSRHAKPDSQRGKAMNEYICTGRPGHEQGRAGAQPGAHRERCA